MSAENHHPSRRHFLKLAAGGAAAVALAGSLPGGLHAADLPHVGGDDPTAKALGYVEDAGKSADAKHKAGDDCANCQFYAGGPAGFGPCQLFPGKAVAAKGWCISHSAKA